jgi:hypothetical protein
MQAKHELGKAAERQTEQQRHSTWASQQRGIFRRQRLEQASRYHRSGMRPRSAYAELGATAAVETMYSSAQVASSVDEASSSGGGGDAASRFFTSPHVRDALGRPPLSPLPRDPRAPLSYAPGGRPRPTTALVASTSSLLRSEVRKPPASVAARPRMAFSLQVARLPGMWPLVPCTLPGPARTLPSCVQSFPPRGH